MIDFHVHIFPEEIKNNRERYFEGERDFRWIYSASQSRLAIREDVLKMMDENGIERSVVFGFPWRRRENFERHNDYIIDTLRLYPDRFVGFATFSLLSEDAPQEVTRCVREGLSGIGELALYTNGEEIFRHIKEIMDIALEMDLPVLIHTNEPVGHQYPGKVTMDLRKLYDFLKQFPNNRIILAHWGGGLFFYSTMKKEVDEILSNVYFDTSASPFLYKKSIWKLAGEIIGFHKILFGSDYPLINPSRYLQEIKSSGLQMEQILKITKLNAQKVLGIAP